MVDADAANVGVVVGPPIGGLLLVLGSWSALFPTVAVLSGVAWLIAYRFLPHRGDYAPESAPDRGSLAVIFGDRRFLIFLGSAVFAVYGLAVCLVFKGENAAGIASGLIVIMKVVSLIRLIRILTGAIEPAPGSYVRMR